MFFSTLKKRIRDMGTIKALCLGAERHANADGQKEPGAEHFLLSALELPDGTARKAFEKIQLDPNRFHQAIAQQYDDALRSIGIEAPPHASIDSAALPVTSRQGIYKAQPSSQILMQRLAEQQKAEPDIPLLGAHVIMAVVAARYGVAVRALQSMGADLEKLANAARVEVDAAIRTA